MNLSPPSHVALSRERRCRGLGFERGLPTTLAGLTGFDWLGLGWTDSVVKG